MAEIPEAYDLGPITNGNGLHQLCLPELFEPHGRRLVHSLDQADALTRIYFGGCTEALRLQRIHA